jgi:hypothetical protein
VSLLCKVSSVPESTLEWLFNGQPLSNASLNLLVETTNAYPMSSPVSLSSSSHQSGPSPSSLASSSIPIEKKSELLILNATADENGTFLCVARNPAGLAMANFTVRVLTKYDTETSTEYYSIGTIPLFVSSYPNLFIIVLSTVAVIGFVIVMFLLSLLVCKCSRLCGRGRRGRRSSSRSGSGSLGCSSDGRSNGKNKKKDGKNSHNHYGNGGSGGGDGKDCSGGGGISVVSICGGGGKMDRHLSETSTLTTHTKSNGSVFLLSTSSEMGLGDSNPDLIEGVKRVEGDGHETSFTNSSYNNANANSIYCSSSNIVNNSSSSDVPQQQHSYGTIGRNSSSAHALHHHTTAHAHQPNSGSQPSSAVILEPSGFNPFPMDYGLPTGKGLSVSTLVRRSPSYPVTQASSSIPSNYDLAKYPKEYISPHPHPHPPSSPYGYLPNPHQHPHLIGYSTSQTPGPADYYPTYILPPGTYVTTYSGPGGEEYAAIATMGGYIDNSNGTNSPSTVPQGVLVSSSPMVNCSCAPILEGNESPESEHNNGQSSTSTTHAATATSPTLLNNKSESQSLMMGESSSSSSSKCCGAESKKESTTGTGGGNSNSSSTTTASNTTSSSVGGCSGGGNNNNITRLQRQLTTQINESPDEGYEDESAEGTEI